MLVSVNPIDLSVNQSAPPFAKMAGRPNWMDSAYNLKPNSSLLSHRKLLNGAFPDEII